MGIQDDIFDVEHSIGHHSPDDTELMDSFDRIIYYINRLEKTVEENLKYIRELETTIKTLRKMDEKGS